jgi:hypothetical protein
VAYRWSVSDPETDSGIDGGGSPRARNRLARRT